MVLQLAPPRMIGHLFLAINLGVLMSASRAPSADFTREIQPLLAAHCYRCHGPDEAQRKGGLRLDDARSSIATLPSGRRAIVPGKPSESELVRRIFSKNPEEKMPPGEAGDGLTDSERAVLQQWIESGAERNMHWAFVVPVRPPLPADPSASLARNPIDAFVHAKLSETNLRPAPEADRETLLRRLTLTLTGLPPTPAERDAFLSLSETQPDAYEQAVDRLLHSPRYGEHFARVWLDAARYGDTHGLHLDNVRSMWPYRDWVIEALNENLSFDQFTIQQMAGDLLPDATVAQRVATGFHRCNVTTNEEGSIDAECRVRYAMDRVETMAATWMGLTLNCAACHDHKFDPISQREYYQLFAYFDSVTDQARDGDVLVPPPSVRVADRTQKHKHRQLTAQLSQIDAQLSELRNSAAPHLDAWEAEYRNVAATAHIPSDTLLSCSLERAAAMRATLSAQERQVPVEVGTVGSMKGNLQIDAGRRGKSLRLDGQSAVTFAIPSKPSDPTESIWTLALSAYSEQDTAAPLLGFQPALTAGGDTWLVSLDDDSHLVITLHNERGARHEQFKATEPLARRKWQTLVISCDRSASASESPVGVYVDGQPMEMSHSTVDIRVERPDHPQDHDRLSTLVLGDFSSLKISPPTPAPNERKRFCGMLDDVRLYHRKLTTEEIGALSAWDPVYESLVLPKSARSASQQATITNVLLSRHVPDFQSLQSQRRQIDQQRQRLESQFASALVLQQASEPADVNIRIRGQYDQLGDRVTPNVPAFLPPLPTGAGPNRLSLAQWLVDPSHPLTARVMVNRIWQHHFGEGLVATPEDFGTRGELPSHAQLLDWLAVEFRESGWDIKHIHRLIVNSATFRQSSRVSSTAYAQDPANRLLARGPRFRLDAEVIRDTALASSGLLVEQLGGPSGKVYQPVGLWEAIGYTNSNTAHFHQDHGSALYRRSLYTFWKRTSPPPTMQILNAPSREVCTLRRQRSNTPTAALALMNDVQFVEAARQFAQRLLLTPMDAILPSQPASNQATSATPDSVSLISTRDHRRLLLAWLIATGRYPESQEIAVLHELLQSMRTDFQSDKEGARQLVHQGESPVNESLDAIELASWTIVCNTLLNLDEVIQQW